MTPNQKLDALIGRLTPQIRDAFLAAVSDIVNNQRLNQIITLIEQRNFDAVFDALNISRAAFAPLESALVTALETVGVVKASTFPRFINTTAGAAIFRFDIRNPRAEQWLREKSSSLITTITNDARVVVRNTLERGMLVGRNPRSVALDVVGRIDPVTRQRVGGAIGLTVNQDQWVASARSRLETLDDRYFTMELRDRRFDATVQRAIREGRPLDADTVTKLTDRYRARALQHRGEMIGRTEALSSLNHGEYEATVQAHDTGAFEASAVERVWDDTGDGRTRLSHRVMDGQRVGLYEPFVTPMGFQLMHPGDASLGAPGDEIIACRCRTRTEIDWLSNVT